MSDLGWRADGISRALACGGIELERYRKPGFQGGVGVRRATDSGPGGGFETWADPDYYEEEIDPTPQARKRR